MFPKWRLKIRDARRAYDEGRWDEASALLRRESVREFLPAKQLSQEVASQLVDRAGERLEIGESAAGWDDLRQASHLGGQDEQIAELRQAYAQSGLERIKQLLVCGETSLASRQITKLEQRRLGGEQRRVWKLIVHLISQAKELAQRGKIAAAIELLGRAKTLLPENENDLTEQIANRQSVLRQHAEKIGVLIPKLHEALSKQDWSEVLPLAEALLELAPEHTTARQARHRAWKAVGMDATRSGPRKNVPASARLDRELNNLAATTTGRAARSAKEDTMTIERESGRRLVAWIDGVGAYLICLGDEVALGQPTGPPQVDIPILGDLSRRHASLRREGEAYVLTPIHQVSIDGQQLAGPTALTSGCTITLGDTVRLKFRKPHALSATAVLTVESHHKTEPAVDAIVLMSESCILGSQPHSHIRCRDWPEEMVLFRRGESLQMRTNAEVEIDGLPADSDSIVTGNCRLESENFAMSFEDL